MNMLGVKDISYLASIDISRIEIANTLKQTYNNILDWTNNGIITPKKIANTRPCLVAPAKYVPLNIQ